MDRARKIRDEDDGTRENGDEDEIAPRVIRFDLRSQLAGAVTDLALREVDLADPRIAC